MKGTTARSFKTLLATTPVAASDLHALSPPEGQTSLTMASLEARQTFAYIGVVPGPTCASVGAGLVRARMHRVLHVHTRGEALGQWDDAIVQEDLRENGGRSMLSAEVLQETSTSCQICVRNFKIRYIIIMCNVNLTDIID